MHGKGIYKYKNGKIVNGILNNGQIDEVNMKFKSIKEKKNNIIGTNTFDYKNKFRNVEMDTYTFDETRNYIKNYILPSDNTNEGKKMSIYKINPKINLDVSYNKNIFRQLYRNKIIYNK